MDSKIDETSDLKVDKVLNAVLEKLEKKYQCIKHLGGGEFSNVYLVRHKDSGEEYALKIMDYHYLLQKLKKEDLAESRRKFEEIKKRFFVEAKLYEKIDHPNIVKILSTGVVLDRTNAIEIPYLLMNYIKGASLANVIKREAPFDIERLLKISRNVLGVLDLIHQRNIIHRDIKPANIMIEKESGEAIIIDFGIAKDIVGGTRLTTTGALLGSPGYMAPEQFIDSSKVGPGIDIYSYGIVLFEMATGDLPFPAANFLEVMNAHRQKSIPNASEKNPALSPEMDVVLAKAMAKDPEDRFQSAKDFLNALQGGKIKERKKGKGKYIFLLAAFIAVIALFIVNPLGSGKKIVKPEPPGGDAAQEEPIGLSIQKTPSVKTREEQMAEAFNELESFLNSNAGDREKIKRGRTFLEEFKDVPGGEKKRDDLSARLVSIETEQNYLDQIDAVKAHIKNDQYREAEASLEEARKIKDNDEVKQLADTVEKQKIEYEKIHGEEKYNNLKSIDLKVYLEFKAAYPQSKFLAPLKEKLKVADKRLPPEAYWEKAIEKNQKGYYEFTFETGYNGHRMIYIPALRIWIDKYEVSWGQFKRFPGYEKARVNVEKSSQYIKNGDDYPAVVTHEDAAAYCKYFGLRLPRRDEWELAAGRETVIYPWGNQDPNADGIWRANIDSLEGSEEKDGFNGTAPVKSFESFASPYGVVNMAGNVSEWVEGKILKGGGFLSVKSALRISESNPGRDIDKEGFRCAKDEKNGE
jgi:serine/threonine protein kinase